AHVGRRGDRDTDRAGSGPCLRVHTRRGIWIPAERRTRRPHSGALARGDGPARPESCDSAGAGREAWRHGPVCARGHPGHRTCPSIQAGPSIPGTSIGSIALIESGGQPLLAGSTFNISEQRTTLSRACPPARSDTVISVGQWSTISRRVLHSAVQYVHRRET